MLLGAMEISQGTAQKLMPQEESDGRDIAYAEIRLTVQSVSYENRGTNTVHIPKQG